MKSKEPKYVYITVDSKYSLIGSIPGGYQGIVTLASAKKLSRAFRRITGDSVVTLETKDKIVLVDTFDISGIKWEIE